MVPLFAFALFAADPQPAAMAAPSANVVQDFRLAASVETEADGATEAIIDISETSTTADGHPWARVYMVGEIRHSPLVIIAYVKFDCAARSFVTEHAWALDRNLDVLSDREINETLSVRENTLGAQQIDFMCGGRQAQLQRPYLGSDYKAAIRLADPRFR